MSKLKVYHVGRSRSLRALWLLEELGLPYDVEKLEFLPGNFGGDAYTKIHPLNKVPALEDGEMVMSESIAIMQYIMNKYGAGHLRPETDSPEYGPYLQWLHYGESSLAPIVVNLMYQRHFFKPEQRSESIDIWAQKELSKYLSILEDQLGDHDYILESGFSAADISIGYTLLLIRLAQAKEQITPRIEKYWKTLTARDSWKKVSEI
ncbi:MAG: glutathione S-transferase [Robiginitomaculum sp.]|nr:MAG: glutathione S-transferase [Robiginitomaculum sp.]